MKNIKYKNKIQKKTKRNDFWNNYISNKNKINLIIN